MSRASQMTFSQEIFDTIIDMLSAHRQSNGVLIADASSTLQACALASRTLQSRARSALFRTVLITMPESAEALNAIISQSPATAKAVVLMRIDGNPGDTGQPTKFLGKILSCLPRLIASCGSLQQLDLISVDLQPLFCERDARNAFYHAVGQTITHASIYNCRFETRELVAVLHSMRHLACLLLKKNTRSPNTGYQSNRVPPNGLPAIQRLIINDHQAEWVVYLDHKLLSRLTMVIEQMDAVVYYNELINRAPNVEEIALTITFSGDVDLEHDIEVDFPFVNLDLSVCACLQLLQVTFSLDETFYFQRQSKPARDMRRSYPMRIIDLACLSPLLSCLRICTPTFDANFVNEFPWSVLSDVIVTHGAQKDLKMELVIMDDDVPGAAADCVRQVTAKLQESGSVGVVCVLDS
jgi:hypothetical protein